MIFPRVGCRRPDLPRIQQPRDLAQDFALPCHVGRLEQRPREHQLPADRDRLRLERAHVERLRIVDQSELTLRRDQLRNLLDVRTGVVDRKHPARRAQTKRLDLLRQRFAVVDNVVGTKLPYPVLGLLARSGGDHGQVGQSPQKLDRDRSNAAGPADDEHRIGRAGIGSFTRSRSNSIS